ncbi:hypothetical protein CCC_01454 [Paramagnetospirillum magnetotacticum MS-1]|uniref:Uncharacterized protein n=1 Tax=Paramagnetospirillum magnetotacticum MS-1 TaxID=272627 RepID=A0A0C2UVW5_PARME|nr:hypothetical protein [Paramagnetospirillum magnetotacticum]KIL96961.1 hypothetical protein CCC_01454 [Paramagnetospirillum magnetotacticum MS-1]
MRSTWPFIAGAIIAGLVTLFTMPILVATGLIMMAAGSFGKDEAALSGGSGFSMRDERGRITSKLINTTYSIVSVPITGEPRPRRTLLRQRVTVGDDGIGKASLSAWLVGAPSELRKAPLFHISVAAHSANLGDDFLFWTETAGRRTAYSLANGDWLFDADMPLVTFAFEAETRRMAALSKADEEYSAKGGVAVFTYAAPGRVLRRAVLVVDDPMRAGMLRATLSATKLVTYTDEALGGRIVELPLGSGTVRIPVTPTEMDLRRAVVPAGMRLVPIQLWG